MRGIGADLDQIPSKEHLPTLDLGTLFGKELFYRGFVGGSSCVEGPGGDVSLQELLIDDVDHGGNQGFNKLRARCESFDIA
jgi:hypothetical protein